MTHTKKRRILATVIDLNEFIDQYEDYEYDPEHNDVPYILESLHQPTSIKGILKEASTFVDFCLNTYEKNFLEDFIKYLKDSYRITSTDPIVIISNN